MTENRLYPKSYGSWGGNPAGTPPDFTRCCDTVVDRSTRWYRPHQCNRKRGYGPDEAYCRQHDPAAKTARQHEANQRHAEEMNRKRPEWHGAKFLAVLRQIAAGHNDARGLAAEVVAKFDAGAHKVEPVPTPTASREVTAP